MSWNKISLNLVVVAALTVGAAIPTAAQRKRTATATRKQAVAPTSTEPAPAKKNQRADDAATAQSNAAGDSVETTAPAKKNAAARPAEQSGEPAGSNDVAAKKNADDVRYTYEFSQPEFDVRRVQIEHDAAGRGTITFERKNEDKPLTEKLEISPTAFARIVSAWEALKFLDSDASYQADKQFPHLGTIRLSMKRGTRERATQFNWTNNEQAAVLKREYQRLTDQQLFVFDMDIARQYQPSETVRILKRLEILLDHDEISDKFALAPLLTDLTTDERIPLIARNQAARLLKQIEKETK